MAGYEISYVAAAGGGLISFLSPCVLPLVPGYLCFLAGTTLDDYLEEDRVDGALVYRTVGSAGAFVLGFSTVFVTLGASASAISLFLRDNLDVLGTIASVLIIVFGLHYMGAFRIALFNREVRFNPERMAGPMGAYFIGLAFAFGWTPCIGPILATILTIAATQDSLGFGISLLSVYSLGLGIPFLLAALAVKPFMAFARRFRQHMRKLEIGAGGLLVVTGMLILTGTLETFGFYLLDVFPWLGAIG